MSAKAKLILEVDSRPTLSYTAPDKQEYAVFQPDERYLVCKKTPDGWVSLGRGMDGDIKSLAYYKGELIAGGRFALVDRVIASNIAKWNGEYWEPLGRGINDWVDALAVYNDELVAGGYFTTAGGVRASGIAKWDGEKWSSLGAGMTRGEWAKAYVPALAVYNGELIAGGIFFIAGVISANGLAKWNGKEWASMDSGIGESTFDLSVRSLSVSNGELIAQGHVSFAGEIDAEGVAKWDGDKWVVNGSRRLK